MRRAAAWTLAVCTFAAGCGSSGGNTEEPSDGSLEALWRAPGDDVTIVPGAADFGPGPIRLSFLVVDSEGRVVTRPTARVWLARALDAKPFAETTARSESIGIGDAEEIYVARFRLDRPGKYWLLAEPVGGRKIQALGNVVVEERTKAPAVGEKAIASRTPTLASTGGDLDVLSTATKPDRELYRTSVADALAAKDPFVVMFATPAYCQTRICGPMVDVLSEVRQRRAGDGVRFLHVEIYERNEPGRGPNRWVKEWRLPSEPFTFLVGRDGSIAERFEGAVSVGELDEAVRRHLARR